MFPIVAARSLAPQIRRYEVEAPRVARSQRAGQFVIVRLHERGERIPLTIAGADPDAGIITLVVQAVGKTTRLLCELGTGDGLLDLVGPLGKPSKVDRFGTVAVIGGGVGTAIIHPTARALRAAGNRILSIVGARSRELVILEDEVRATSDATWILTDDGSYGERGLVTTKLGQLLEQGEELDRVLACGPVAMMRAVAEATRPAGLPTVVSLNSIMVDGTGMCGGCRVLVGGKNRFACVDGPEFDAHEVDFDVLARRNTQYRDAERVALERFEHDPRAELERLRQECRLAARVPELATP
jgi:ferredoxin--NADP+ reductase